MFVSFGLGYADMAVAAYAAGLSDTCRITFFANNGSGESYVQSVARKTDTRLEKNRFTYEGHVFMNWNTRADGSGITYYDQQVVNLESDLTLYARWQDNRLLSNVNLTPVTTFSTSDDHTDRPDPAPPVEKKI